MSKMLGISGLVNGLQRPRRAAVPSANERRFREILLASPDLPRPLEQYRVVGWRKFRFDFAWEDFKIAVECDGIYRGAGGGRHHDGSDAEKLALARQQGWLVLHFSAQQLRDSEYVLTLVWAMLERRGFQPAGRK